MILTVRLLMVRVCALPNKNISQFQLVCEADQKENDEQGSRAVPKRQSSLGLSGTTVGRDCRKEDKGRGRKRR